MILSNPSLSPRLQPLSAVTPFFILPVSPLRRLAQVQVGPSFLFMRAPPTGLPTFVSRFFLIPAVVGSFSFCFRRSSVRAGIPAARLASGSLIAFRAALFPPLGLAGATLVACPFPQDHPLFKSSFIAPIWIPFSLVNVVWQFF